MRWLHFPALNKVLDNRRCHHGGLRLPMNRAPISRFGAKSAGGSTILGSGEVALILDVPGLMKSVVASEEPAGDKEGLPALNQ